MKKTNKNGVELAISQVKAEGEVTPHVEIITVAERVKQEISRFTIPKQKIAGLKKKNLALVITGLDDKKGYKAVDEARKELKALRNAVENKRKELKDDYLRTGQGIDAYAKDLTAAIQDGEGGENDLIAKLKKIDDEIEAERIRQEKEAEEKLEARVTGLTEAGLVFDGRFYSMGEISLDIVSIQGLPNEAYDVLLKNVKLAKAEKDRRAEELRQKEEQEKAEVARQKEINDQKAKELQEREDAIARKEEQAKEERTLGRGRFIAGLGFSYDPNGFWRYQTPSGSLEVAYTDIVAEDEQQWQTRSEGVQKRLNEIKLAEDTRLKEEKNKENAAAQLRARNEIRFAKVEGLGFFPSTAEGIFRFMGNVIETPHIVSYSDVTSPSDEDFVRVFEGIKANLKDFKDRDAELGKQRAIALENNRKAGLSDSQKLTEYLGGIRKAITPVVLTSEAAKLAQADFWKTVEAAAVKLEQDITELTK